MKYPYACTNCDREVTVERSIHDTSDAPFCETCGYHMIRVYEAPGVSFKGGGFYSTGNR